MKELSNLKPPVGATKTKKRLGRGPGSGLGKTAGKGHKGARARAGSKHAAGFEGGQMPLQRRLPKRGFKNLFRQVFETINVHQLNRFENGSVVDAKALQDAGLVKNLNAGVKLLGHGTLERTLTVRIDRASKSAAEKVKALGGLIEVLRGE